MVAISVSLLIIFGFALFLYAPSRSTGQSLQQTSAVAQREPSNSTIDPDAWVREPGSAPNLETKLTPSPNNINLTIVNGDNAGANYGTLDVSGLTTGDPQTTPPQNGSTGTSDSRTGVLPDSTALEIPGQTKTQEPLKSTVQSQTQTAPVKTAPTKTATATTLKSDVAKPVPTKTVTVTDYWIQTGSFASKINAEKARDSLTARYLKAEIFTKAVSGATTYRVRVGPYKSKTEADYWLGTVKDIPEFNGSYVSEVKTKK